MRSGINSNKKYYEKNKKRILARQKEYYEKNKKSIRNKTKKYREETKSQKAQMDRLYYLKNKEKVKERKRNYYEKNKNRIKDKSNLRYEQKKHLILLQTKDYRQRKKEELKKYFEQYYIKNRERKIFLSKEWSEKNKDRRNSTANKRNKERRKKDLNYRLRCNLKNYVKRILKNYILNKDNIKSIPSIDLVGCSLDFLKKHIESQFKPGMGWENWSFRGWHIDHIIPLSSARTEDDLYLLCHYSNLQPLWAIDNMKKGGNNKIKP